MYNLSSFFCKRNEISPEYRDFLIKASAIPRFPSEKISFFRKSECDSEKPFFTYYNLNPCDSIGSKFGDCLFFLYKCFPKTLFSFEDKKLFILDKKVGIFELFSASLGFFDSLEPFLDLSASNIIVHPHSISQLQKLLFRNIAEILIPLISEF